MGNGLVVPMKQYDLTNAEQTIEVEVQKNVSYNVTIDEAGKSWITQTNSKALTTDKLYFKIAANTTYGNREGHITIKQSNGNLSEVITVKQGQTNGLFVTTPEYDLSNAAHILSVEVKANVEFDVVSEASWISYVETKGLKSSIITLNVAANETYDNRTATVKVKQRNGDITGIITINQKQTDGLFVTPSSFDLTNQAQDIEVEVKKNVTYSIVIPDSAQDWISVKTPANTKALETDKVILSIAANSTYDNREASITFKQTDGALAETVNITQAQLDNIRIDQQTYNISADEQTLDIIVHANIPYDIKIDKSIDWINHINTKGLPSIKHSFKISNNESEERTGEILFYGNGIQIKVTIKQRSRIVPFEDPAFKEYCLYYFDFDGDNVLTQSEAEEISTMYINTETISSLKGIEYMTNLKNLECKPKFRGSRWSGQDGKWTLYNENEEEVIGLLTSLDLSNNPKLIHLDCQGNQIVHLDLSGNPYLRDVYCAYNYIKTINISHNSYLLKINCGKNKIDELNVNNNVYLQQLDCSCNNLYSLNISNNVQLVTLECQNNHITNLDLSNNSVLETIICIYNSLTSLDINDNAKLQVLFCDYNNITSLDTSHIILLKNLSCMFTKLATLDVSNNVFLESLQCRYTPDLKEIWLKTGQTIRNLSYDQDVAVIKYKD